jgi:hypothetical protein
MPVAANGRIAYSKKYREQRQAPKGMTEQEFNELLDRQEEAAHETPLRKASVPRTGKRPPAT